LAESLIIVWEKNKISLKLIESSGIWLENLPELKNIEIPRPSRLSRIIQQDKQQYTSAAILDLLENTDINQPLWFLIPENWTTRIEVDSPEFPSEELRHDHLEWEASQRLSGDIENYNIHIIEQDYSETVEIRIIRSDLLEAINAIMRSIDLPISGISTEPAVGESYSFETPYDLRESRPFESDDAEVIAPHRSTINPIAAVLIVAVIAAVGWFWSKGSNDESEVKTNLATSAMHEEKSLTASIDTTSPMLSSHPDSSANKESAVKKASSEMVKGEVAPLAKVTTAKAKPVSKSASSPLVALQRSLPKGATIELAVISPMDMRIEVSGQINTNSWINTLKKSSALNQIKSVGNYTESGRKLTVVELKKPELIAGRGSRNILDWRTKAISAGMSVKGRNATGSSSEAFAFIESLWKDMHGFSKIYLAHAGNNWVITIQ